MEGVVEFLLLLAFLFCGLVLPNLTTNIKYYNRDNNRDDWQKESEDVIKNNLSPMQVRRNIVAGKYERDKGSDNDSNS